MFKTCKLQHLLPPSKDTKKNGNMKNYETHSDLDISQLHQFNEVPYINLYSKYNGNQLGPLLFFFTHIIQQSLLKIEISLIRYLYISR